MKGTKLLITAFFILLIALLPVYASDNQNPLPADHSAGSSKTISLSQYTAEHSFTDRIEIEIIAEEYNLGNPETIEEIIYVPLDEEINEHNKVPLAVPDETVKNEFYIKNIQQSEQRGELLYSSRFCHPSGKMEISDKIPIDVTFTFQEGMKVEMEVPESELNAVLGFSVTGSRKIVNSQSIKVKSGCKRNLKAYVNLKVYKYQLWENDPVSDDYYGSGSVKKPIGVVFTMGDNIKL